MKYIVAVDGIRRAEFVKYSDAVNFYSQTRFYDKMQTIHEISTGEIIHVFLGNS